MKAMQVHAHMQAAVLKLFPDQKLPLLDADEKICNLKLGILQNANSDRIKFDVAETWMMHVYVPGQCNFYSFIKKVEAMDLSAYESVMFGVYTSYSDLNQLSNSTENISGLRRAYMNEEDMVSFLQENTTLFEGEKKAIFTPSPREYKMREESTNADNMREESTNADNMHEDNRHEDNTDEDETREGKKRKHKPQKHRCGPPTYQESMKQEYSIQKSRPLTHSMDSFSSTRA